MRSFRVDTDRLGMQVYESGPEDGIPVVLIHGNLSTGRFYEHLFDVAPDRYRLIAPDMRSFGDSDPAPLDATRGLRDWADDTFALLRALDVAAPPHLVGWSTGGAAIAEFALRAPGRVADLHRPGRPVRLRRRQARRHAALRRLRGLRRRDRQPGVHRAPGGRRHAPSEGDTAPRNVLNSSYWRPDYRDEREDMLLAEVLKSVTGDDGYPGDTTTSEHWPGVAPGTRGLLNALSPKYCNWSSIVELDVKPPILWTHGTHDIVIADGSPWEMGTLGSLGVVPGWPGEAIFPPQPMVDPAARRVHRVRGGRRAGADVDVRGLGALPGAGRA